MTEQYNSKNDENDDANSQIGVEKEDTPTESNDSPTSNFAESGSFSDDGENSHGVDLDEPPEDHAGDTSLPDGGDEESSGQKEPESNDRKYQVGKVIEDVNKAFYNS